ncbi:MAG: hypothetical protein AABY01_03820 [Nanoarchaeota archaeon]
MIKTFYITQHDLQPYYPVQVKSTSGGVVDLTSATIRCNMKTKKGTAIQINRGTTGVNVSDATNGNFEYRWQSGETGTTGQFYIEFEITPSSGGKFTVPNYKDGRAEVQIVAGLDNV